MLKVERNKVIFALFEILQLCFLLVMWKIEGKQSYSFWAVIGLAQWLLNTVFAKCLGNLPIISIPNMFAFFSFVFHCGQILKSGFKIEGTVPLPFENYANMGEIKNAFYFYLFSQILFYSAVVFEIKQNGRTKNIVSTKWKKRSRFDISTYATILMCIGIFPRLYIDILSLIGARLNGYEGVYTIYFPQAVQSLAFLFDAGLFFLLFGKKDTKYESKIFWGTILYKCLMMTSGGRQEKVAFLLVWIYVYYFVINKISLKKIVIIVFLGIGGFWFISAIGTVRAENTTNISQILDLLHSGTMKNVFGNALGEFGAAFVTLEVACKYTPLKILYGYGRTFLAGCLSVVPLLINQIPWLSKTVVFLTQLPQSITFAMGGSYLGELYYNFSWFGILGNVVLGIFIAKLHNGIIDNSMFNDLYKAWCTVLSMAIILYVRGYFTDMMQKLVWTYFAIYLIYCNCSEPLRVQ